jgi:putative hemolysin
MDGDPSSGRVLLVGNDWSTALFFFGPYVALILLLLTLAGIVSAAEAAFFSLSPSDRATCRDSDRPTDQRIGVLLSRPKRLLASLVIFNNLLNIAVVVITTYLAWAIPALATTTNGTLAAVTLLTTLAIVLFGEMIPKVLANQNALTVVRRTTPLVQVASLVFRPLSVLLVRLSNAIDKRIERRGYTLSAEALSQAVDLTGHEATAEQKDILKGIVNFSNLTARQVMRARMDIVGVSNELTFKELVIHINESGYSRVPVYAETIDQIDGILYSKDLLPHLNQADDFEWRLLVRPVFFTAETKKIDDLLHDFQRRRVHLAIVADEYGGTSGLITLEDIIEEIFGDINDEFDDDEHSAPYQRIAPNTIRVAGKTALPDLCRMLDIEATTFDTVQGEAESLGGLLLELFGHLPRPSQTVETAGFRFTVMTADDKRIGEVEIMQL